MLPFKYRLLISEHLVYVCILTILENRPQQAGTANMLNTADPTMVPTPRSPSVTKVPTELINNSGLELAVAMKVAPAMSSFICKSVKKK